MFLTTYTKVSIVRHPIDYLISNYYFFGFAFTEYMDFRELCNLQAPVAPLILKNFMK